MNQRRDAGDPGRHLGLGRPPAGRRHQLAARLEASEVLSHPFVIGELALGNLRQRKLVLGALSDLPAAVVASEAEVLALIERQPLHGFGIGYVDAHLLASALLTPDATVWTRDGRLEQAAAQLGLAVRP